MPAPCGFIVGQDQILPGIFGLLIDIDRRAVSVIGNGVYSGQELQLQRFLRVIIEQIVLLSRLEIKKPLKIMIHFVNRVRGPVPVTALIFKPGCCAVVPVIFPGGTDYVFSAGFYGESDVGKPFCNRVGDGIGPVAGDGSEIGAVHPDSVQNGAFIHGESVAGLVFCGSRVRGCGPAEEKVAAPCGLVVGQDQILPGIFGLFIDIDCRAVSIVGNHVESRIAGGRQNGEDDGNQSQNSQDEKRFPLHCSESFLFLFD